MGECLDEFMAFKPKLGREGIRRGFFNKIDNDKDGKMTKDEYINFDES